MKIVHVITRLYKGGAEENTLMNCLHQAQSGHEATLMYGPDNFTPELYAPFQKDIHFQPVAYLKHPIQLINDLRGLYELVALFKKLQPDIVHKHESKAGVLGRLAAKCAGVRHIVHGVHIIPFNNVSLPQKILFVAAEHVSALITDLFVHVSAGTRQAYARARIGASKAHHVVYSGMNIDKFIQAREPEDWRSLLNVSPSSPKPKVIVMLAVLEPRKQQLGFLDGFARATKPGDNIRLILAGDGPLKDEITVRIAALNLSDRVIMAGAFANSGTTHRHGRCRRAGFGARGVAARCRAISGEKVPRRGEQHRRHRGNRQGRRERDHRAVALRRGRSHGSRRPVVRRGKA